MTNKWDTHWLRTARFHAESLSKDPRTKVGCVITDVDNNQISTGYNGIPRGVLDLRERLERPAKYLFTSHAEENAIAQAARVGAMTKGCTAYVTHCPCARCARMLIQAGIVRAVYDIKGTTSMPEEEFIAAKIMLIEAGIELVCVNAQ